MNARLVFWAFVAGAMTVGATLADDGVDSSDRSWIKAAAICLLHVFATQLRPFLKQRADLVNSFAGGMSVTYVFGHLLPELSEAHDYVGGLIYIVVLVGFVAYYGLQRRVRITRAKSENVAEQMGFKLTIGGYWLYNALIVFGLPDGPSVSVVHVALMTVAMVLHLAHSDYDMGSEHPVLFDRWGRYVVAAAPVVGLVCRVYLRPDEALIQDILTAMLAGSVMFSVFKSELPYPEKTDFRMFLVGIVTYTALLVLASQF